MADSDRNPSPPPEFEGNDVYKQDLIGDTAVSQKWIYKILMDMIQEVNKHKANNDENAVVDIPDNLETDCSTLWDLSMDTDIALFFNKCDGIKIIGGIILESKSPRLTEICVGIIGNVICCKKVCTDLTNTEELRILLVSLLSTRDPPTLLEVARLLHVAISNKDLKALWLKTIEESSALYENLTFILKNSTNCGLLESLLEVVDTCIADSETLLKHCIVPEFIECIIESGNQIIGDNNHCSEKPFAIGAMLHVLQIISTDENSCKHLEKHAQNIFDICDLTAELWMENECEELSKVMESQKIFNSEHVAIGSLISLLTDIPAVLNFAQNKENCNVIKLVKYILKTNESEISEENKKSIKSESNTMDGKKFIIQLATSFHKCSKGK